MAVGRSVVFVTGGTGYLGKALIPALLSRGHVVRALIRPGAEQRLPAGAQAVPGNALEGATFVGTISPAKTLVHLVGTSRPSPAKATQFQQVDLVSIEATLAASRQAGVQHLVYVSVAQPAPVMQAYIAVRQQGEALIRESGLAATILRPWYVLGPGHRWPYVLLPLYALLSRVPDTRAGATRLGLVTLQQMVGALVRAVEHPATGVRVVEVPEIREPY